MNWEGSRMKKVTLNEKYGALIFTVATYGLLVLGLLLPMITKNEFYFILVLIAVIINIYYRMNYFDKRKDWGRPRRK
jgi:NADH:ubiquinone oxidoreductase subunit 4 (subunit M)